ncbi:MAG: hypothetical protein H0X03_08250 [Nitrosopumilus sp.]|nr:hypothetical protein [Nitrosopumilus sp.]
MPHIVIEGKINFELIYNNFVKTVERSNNYIIKFDDSFLNHSKDLILIKTMVIENNTHQNYYIQLMKKENQTTVRLDPVTDPINKTNSVKISISKIAKMIFLIHKESNLSITKTNLEGYI